MTTDKINGNDTTTMNEWFDTFINHIKVDHFMLQTDSAPKETKDLYNAFFNRDELYVKSIMRSNSTQFFIEKIIIDYLTEVKEMGRSPLKLALGLSDSKILVWSEINDDDDATEDALIIAEAKINGKYHQHGFYLVSTIMEKSDKISIPPHYKTIIN